MYENREGKMHIRSDTMTYSSEKKDKTYLYKFMIANKSNRPVDMFLHFNVFLIVLYYLKLNLITTNYAFVIGAVSMFN